uniref:Matrin-type domain-containing protein n=1 Tax=Esox lucius TaxID=8010 RepID=A0A3P8XLT3_ESOLU
MSEYWKSQPKKFCQYCKCWIADNKPSVEFHERGKNHKENVAAKIAEMQKKSIDKAKKEDRQSKEFAAMEAAALKAYEEDMKRLGIEPSGSAWMEALSPDGYTYYYNTETGGQSLEKTEPYVEGLSSIELCFGYMPTVTVVSIILFSLQEKTTPPSEKEGEDKAVDDNGGKGDKIEIEAPVAVPVEEKPSAKKPRRTTPYGAWEQIQEVEDPYEKVDLQLPQVEITESTPNPTEMPPEPKPKFRERTITSLGDNREPESGEMSTFRKRKAENGKSSRSLRQRGKED